MTAKHLSFAILALFLATQAHANDATDAANVVTRILDIEDEVFEGTKDASFSAVLPFYSEGIVEVEDGKTVIGMKAYKASLETDEETVLNSLKNGLDVERTHKLQHSRALATGAVLVTVNTTAYYTRGEKTSRLKYVAVYVLVNESGKWKVALETSNEEPEK